MDEIWERAVETALDGQTDVSLVRTLTLDGAVKCVHGHLPAPSIFEKFHNLQHLSIANIGASSLERFPRLRNLQRLMLSDNHISGGLEHLVEAGLESLRDLDLSNNRFSEIDDLRPLAELRLVSLDLYECPVTRVKDYRSRVFGLINSLRYLDKMDAEGNERPESDEEEEEDDDEEDEEYDDDPGSGEIDGDDNQNNQFGLSNGRHNMNDGVVDVDEDEESDADEEEMEMSRSSLLVNGNLENPHFRTNVFHADEREDEDDDSSGDEVYEDDDGEDEDVVEVHEIDDDSEDDEDGVEYDEDDDYEEDEEAVDNDERDFGEPHGNRRSLGNLEGEIDGHEQGEDEADEDDDGETGEEEQTLAEGGVESEEDDEELNHQEDDDEDNSNGYLLQPVGRVEAEAGSDSDEEEEDDLEDEYDGEVQELPPPSSPSAASHKRKRNDEDDSNDDDDDGDGDGDEDEDIVHHAKSSKHL